MVAIRKLQQTTYRTFAAGDEIAVIDEYKNVHIGRVLSVTIERNGYPTTTVSISAPFNMGKGYQGGFAVENLYTPAEAEAEAARRKAFSANFWR